ncbi:MAG: hypothetical protein ACPHID_03840 [Thermoplasmatota archaeon]
MSENHLRLEVREDWDVQESDVDVDLEVAMDVRGHLTKLAWAGIVGLALGAILVFIGAVFFILGYPERWYAFNGDLAASREHVRFVVTTMALGATSMLLGASAFFVGRRTQATGQSDPMRLEAA